MAPGSIIAGLVLLIGGLFFIVKPFNVKGRKKSSMGVTLNSPAEERMAALSALRDLDFDFRTGKVSEEDYPILRVQLVAEAAKFVDLEKEADDRIEALIRERKAAGPRESVCGECGEKLEAGTRFCPHCGTEVGAACPACGGTIKAGDLFCSSCGNKLEMRAEAMA